MIYKFEFFLVIKKAYKYKIIQTLSSCNFIYRVRYITIFLWFIYIGLLVFYTKLTHLAPKGHMTQN